MDLTQHKHTEKLHSDKVRSGDKLTKWQIGSSSQQILETIADAVISLDIDWRVTYANQNVARILGFSPETLLGKNIWDGFLDDVGGSFYTEYNRAMKLQTPFQFAEYSSVLGKWLDTRGYPSPDGLIIFLQDIAERKAVTLDRQTAMAVSERRFKDLFEAILHGIICLDSEARVTAINPAAENMLGVSAAALIGMGFDAKEWTFLEENGNLLPISKYFKEYVLNTLNSFPGRILGVRANPNVEVRWFLVSCIAHCHPGEKTPYQFYSIFADITAQRKSEQALEDVERELRERKRNLHIALESGRLGSYKIDIATWTLIEVSDICKSHFGWPLEEPLTLSDITRSIHPEDLERITQCINRVASMPQNYFVECRVVWRDESVHWIAFSGYSTLVDQDFPTSLTGVTQNITDRKRLEQRPQDNLQRDDLQEALRRTDNDPLTGLLNHRALHNRLEETVRRHGDGRMLAVAILDIDNFKFFNKVYGHSEGDAILRMVANRLKSSCPHDVTSRFGGDEFCIVFSDGKEFSRKSIEERLAVAMRGLEYFPQGQSVSIPITVCAGVSVMERGSLDWQWTLDKAGDRLRVLKSGGSIEGDPVGFKTIAIDSVEGFSMLNALVIAVDNKDRYTRQHSEDVMIYSKMIAAQLGMDDVMQHTTEVAALLHDVGKICVPDAILRKPGQLTEAEMATLRQHPEMGAVIVSAIKGFECILDAVRHHHERWDGMGYPSRLRGEEIPLLARLMAVADAFSAMTTDRPYRRGMRSAEACAILKQGAGHQWDMECVLAFLIAFDKQSDNSQSLKRGASR